MTKKQAREQERHDADPCLECLGEAPTKCPRCRGRAEEPETAHDLDLVYVEELAGRTGGDRDVLTRTVELLEAEEGEPFGSLAVRLRMRRADDAVYFLRLTRTEEERRASEEERGKLAHGW